MLFVQAFTKGIREVDEKLISLFEPFPNEDPPEELANPINNIPNSVYAPHWYKIFINQRYDLHSIFSKSFTSFITYDVRSLAKVYTFKVRKPNRFQQPLIWVYEEQKRITNRKLQV